MAPMSVVQIALAGGVVFIAVMAERMFGFQVGRRQWWGLALTAAGLVLLALILPATHGAHSRFSDVAMISFEAGLFGVGGLLIMGPRMGGPAEHHGMMLGAASGILFGVSDISIKALTGIAHAHGAARRCCSARGCWSPCWPRSWPSTPPLAACRRATPIPVIAVTGTAANIAGIAGGILVFGDPMPGSALGIVLQSLAFVLVIVASALMPAPLRAARLAAA